MIFHAGLAQFGHGVHAKHVGEEVAVAVDVVARRVRGLRALLRDLGVLHHARPSAAVAEDAGFLAGAAFEVGFGNGFRVVVRRQRAEEERVRHLDEAVVNARDHQILYPLRLQLREAALFFQGNEHAAVAVGALQQLGGSLALHPAVGRERRDHGLGEETDLVRGVAEPVAFAEKLHGSGVVQLAGHYIPGHVRSRDPAYLAQPVAMQFKQRFMRGQSQVERPLGPVVTQPRALAARHRQHRQLPRLDQLQTEISQPFALLRGQLIGVHRRQRGQFRGTDFAALLMPQRFLIQFCHLRGVRAVNIVQQPLPLRLAERAESVQQVFLPVR